MKKTIIILILINLALWLVSKSVVCITLSIVGSLVFAYIQYTTKEANAMLDKMEEENELKKHLK